MATYLYKQLQDYKSGTRENAVMTPMTASLSDQDMADVAGYVRKLRASRFNDDGTRRDG